VLFTVMVVMMLVTMVLMVFPAMMVGTSVRCRELLALGVGSAVVMVLTVIMSMIVMVSMLVIVSMIVSMVVVVVMVMVLVIWWGATAIDAHSTNLRISSRGPILSPMSL
jgi:hypothetical protein